MPDSSIVGKRSNADVKGCLLKYANYKAYGAVVSTEARTITCHLLQRVALYSNSRLAAQVYYTIDDIGEGVGKEWKGGVGYVTREMATEHMPPPSDDNLVLICGPPPMYKALSGEKKSPKDQGT